MRTVRGKLQPLLEKTWLQWLCLGTPPTSNPSANQTRDFMQSVLSCCSVICSFVVNSVCGSCQWLICACVFPCNLATLACLVVSKFPQRIRAEEHHFSTLFSQLRATVWTDPFCQVSSGIFFFADKRPMKRSTNRLNVPLWICSQVSVLDEPMLIFSLCSHQST